MNIFLASVTGTQTRALSITHLLPNHNAKHQMIFNVSFPASFYLFLSVQYSWQYIGYISLPTTGFELWTPGVGCNRATN